MIGKAIGTENGKKGKEATDNVASSITVTTSGPSEQCQLAWPSGVSCRK